MTPTEWLDEVRKPVNRVFLRKRILIVLSLILGIIGHVLYSNRKLMERVEWLLILLLGGIIVAVLLVWLLTPQGGP